MKTIKIFTISVLVTLSMNLSAQLKVLSSGSAGIGTSSPSNVQGWNKVLDVRGSIHAKILSTANSANYRTGMYSHTSWHGGGGFLGTESRHNLFLITNYTPRLKVNSSYGAVEILSTDIQDWWSAFRVNVSRPYACAYHMTLNGTDKFYVRGDGLVCSASGFYNYSDIKLKKNITNLEGALKKVINMRGVSYDFVDDINGNEISGKTNSLVDSNMVHSSEIPHSAKADAIEKIKKEKQERKRVGLIAQEVEAIFPDAVRTMHDGTKAISYTDIIPLLIEAMKEQQTQIEELKKSGKDNGKKLKSASVNSNEIVTETLSTSAVLYQNTPNPFSENTEIKYFLPEDVISATLYIYNMQGNQIKSIALYNRGETNETIYGSELQAGMYIYALIADGKEIDSKRMILTD